MESELVWKKQKLYGVFMKSSIKNRLRKIGIRFRFIAKIAEKFQQPEYTIGMASKFRTVVKLMWLTGPKDAVMKGKRRRLAAKTEWQGNYHGKLSGLLNGKQSV